VNQTVLGIAGLGLIGGSIALRARAAGATVIGFDRDPAALAAATAAHAIDGTAPDLATLAARCTVVALALPVDATLAALAATPALSGPELVFDVASVKAPIVRAAAGIERFVASHPLAGRERGGFAAADATLFDGCTWALAPARDAVAQARLETLIVALGARPLVVSAEDHDRLVAISSHLPQMLSVALGARLAAAGETDPRVYDLCGPGMRSMLRLARSDAALWGPIAQTNAPALSAAIRSLVSALESLATGLEAGGTEALTAEFAQAHRAVAALDNVPEAYAVPKR
jgi:prephenate dehydrogenase